MTIFQYTVDKVMSGEKELTSRLKMPGDFANHWHLNGVDDMTINEVLRPRKIPTKTGYQWRSIYVVGKTYPIIPARCKKAVGRYLLLEIKEYDIREITADEARREGFNSEWLFWVTWCGMHTRKQYTPPFPSMSKVLSWRSYTERVREEMKHLPDDKFQAWQLSFKLVT